MPQLPKTKTDRDGPAQVSKKSPAALTKRRIHSRGERAGVRGAEALRTDTLFRNMFRNMFRSRVLAHCSGLLRIGVTGPRVGA